ncbi:MAG: thioredoxin family protein [Saprospiraceae bacterium]|nr:thioredoxin family protein [Saprospiraceae bacterium]
MHAINQLSFWLLFYIGCIVFVGLLTLDIDVARNTTIFIALIGCFLLGIYIRKKNWWNAPFKLYLVSSFGFLFYVIAALILSVSSWWYVGPVVCFLAYSMGFLFANRRLLIMYAALFSSIFAYYSFSWYPQKSFIKDHTYTTDNQEKIDFGDTSLALMDAKGENLTQSLQGKVILIETWNENCGNCFSGMRSLHPFLQEKEKLYKDFKHIYLYTRPLRKRELPIESEEIFKNKYLPYEDMLILEDEKQVFYNKYLPEGFPHFLLIDDEGNIIFSFQGYNKNFKSTYQHYIEKQLEKVFQDNS